MTEGTTTGTMDWRDLVELPAKWPAAQEATEREVAFVMAMRDLLQDLYPLTPEQKEARVTWRNAWDGASPEEAFVFDLSIVGTADGTCRNAGDGSSIPAFTYDRIMDELRILSTWPRPSKWTERRVQQLTEELAERRTVRVTRP